MTRGMRQGLAVAFAVAAVATAVAVQWRVGPHHPAPPPEVVVPKKAAAPGLTGEFETTFSERSPLTAPEALTRRMALAPPAEDYDLGQQAYNVVVPENYDAGTPHALLVFLCYKDVIQGPPELKVVFEREHILFVAPKFHNLPDGTRGGLAVDAVANMRKLYNVDPNRIWLMGNERVASQTAVGFPDVFTGAFLRDLHYWRPVPTGDGRAYPPEIPPPPIDLQERARQMRWVVGDTQEGHAYTRLSFDAFRRDGYDPAMVVSRVDPDTHYPHLTVEWFERVLPYLKDSKAAPASPPAP